MVHQAVVFPGQGSQSVGMLGELAQRYPLVTSLFAAVSERLGYDLWNLVQHGPADLLNQTMHTQVAVLTADVVIYKLMEQRPDFSPGIMAGHSLGEYAALVCSGALELTDAAELVRTRGQLMQDTVPLGVGAMAAIVGLSDEQVVTICNQVSTNTEQVTPANYNAIGQVVIAGHARAVDKAIAAADEMNARLAKIIPVSVPCHCPLLNQAADQFEDALLNANFKVPTIPVISNVNLNIYHSVDQIRTLLKQQLYSPVRWVETIQLIRQKGFEFIIECGPGKVLSGLVKRIDNSFQIQQACDQLLIE
ncbi:MAG: ACP S-malonyltransferase [Legionellaceae bacterium]|nr:ACP S-malonyltransferase [Legionellaceae bacterium]